MLDDQVRIVCTALNRVSTWAPGLEDGNALLGDGSKRVATIFHLSTPGHAEKAADITSWIFNKEL